jgi:hypothetical protein
MQLSIRLVTRPRPGYWPRVLVTILVIVIVSAAGWAWNGPAGIIVAALACGGALAPLAQRTAPAGALGAGR